MKFNLAADARVAQHIGTDVLKKTLVENAQETLEKKLTDKVLTGDELRAVLLDLNLEDGLTQAVANVIYNQAKAGELKLNADALKILANMSQSVEKEYGIKPE